MIWEITQQIESLDDASSIGRVRACNEKSGFELPVGLKWLVEQQ